MNKALEILKEIEAQKPFVYKLTSVWCRTLVINEPYKIKEAIVELEELIKPKSCLSCSSCCKDTQLLSSPPQYPLLCGIFKTVFINDFKQSCNRYDPKEQL